MDENIQTIKIDEDGRYVIIVEGIDDFNFLRDMSKAVKDWWEGSEKFIMLVAYNGAKIKIERIEPHA